MSVTSTASAADLAPFGVAAGHATHAANATGLAVVRGVDRIPGLADGSPAV